MENRKFFPGAWHHVYVISQDGGVLFYRITDRLTFFTILSVFARRYNVTVIGVSIMFTHLHLMVRALDLTQLKAFMQQVLSTFARIVRDDREVSGAIFKRPFGSAPRSSSKDRRSSLIYLLNNPVEKKLCSRAIEDRWTFLAYARKDFPFSERLIKRSVRHCLRNACDAVDCEFFAGRYLRPSRLRKLYEPLTRDEQEQLTDYIIQKYQFLNYEEAVGLFDNFNALLLATEASAGKEYDVGEVFDPSSDVAYREMCMVAARAGLFTNWRLLHLSPVERQRWYQQFLTTTNASERQVRKFLHMEESGVRDR